MKKKKNRGRKGGGMCSAGMDCVVRMKCTRNNLGTCPLSFLPTAEDDNITNNRIDLEELTVFSARPFQFSSPIALYCLLVVDISLNGIAPQSLDSERHNLARIMIRMMCNNQ